MLLVLRVLTLYICFRDGQTVASQQTYWFKTLRKPTEANIMCKVDKIKIVFVRSEISLEQQLFFNNAQKSQWSRYIMIKQVKTSSYVNTTKTTQGLCNKSHLKQKNNFQKHSENPLKQISYVKQTKLKQNLCVMKFH